MKKLLCITLVLCLCAVFCACSGETKTSMNGQYVEPQPINPSREPEGCDHSWLPALCTRPSTCQYCGLEQGSALGHSFMSATCQQPETCERCGYTVGSVADHYYQNRTCIYCGLKNDSVSEEAKEALRKCERYITYNDHLLNMVEINMDAYRTLRDTSYLLDASSRSTEMINNFTEIIKLCNGHPELDLLLNEFRDYDYGLGGGGSVDDILTSSITSVSSKHKVVRVVYVTLCEMYGVETEVQLNG